MRGGEGGWRGGARDKRKGVNTRGMVHIFRIPRADETANVLRQNDTRASLGGGGKCLREICKISWDGKGKRRAASLNEGEAEKAREVPNADL